MGRNIIVPNYPKATSEGRLLQRNVAYDDIVQPATALRGGAAAPANAAWQGGLYRQKFTVDDEIHGEWQMPHGYSSGTAIHPHVHFALDNDAGTNTGSAVNWELTYTICNGTSGVVAAPGAALTKQTTVGESVAYSQFYCDFGDITMTGYAESAIIPYRLKRIAATGDGIEEYGDLAVLMGVDAHCGKDKLGTAQELPPYTP